MIDGDIDLYEGEFRVDNLSETEYQRYELEPIEVPRQSKGDANYYFKRLRDDIRFFADFMFDLDLEPRQIEFANAAYTKPHTTFVSTRQGGKSTMLAMMNCHQLVFGDMVYIDAYAPTERQALKVIFARTRQLFESQPILEDQIANIMKSGWIEMHPQDRSVLPNSLQAMTANTTSNTRGFSASILELDESGDIPDVKFYADIGGSGAALKGIKASEKRRIAKLRGQEKKKALAELGKRTKTWECGTPKGRNHFEKHVNQPRKYNTYVVKQPYWECSFIDLDYVEGKRLKWPMAIWKQEFCCEFNLDSDYAFDYDLVQAACIIDPTAHHEWNPHNLYFGGVDLGRRVDHSVLSIFHANNVMRDQVFNYRFPLHMPWTQIANECLAYLQQWKPRMTIVDATGTGRMVFESFFRSLHGIEGWIYTLDNKAQLMRNLQVLLEKGHLHLWNDELLKEEFESVPEKQLPTGKPQYLKPDSGHDDQVQAAALACMAASMSIGDGSVDMKIAYDAISHDLDDGYSGPNPWAQQQSATRVKRRGSSSIWDVESASEWDNEGY